MVLTKTHMKDNTKTQVLTMVAAGVVFANCVLQYAETTRRDLETAINS